jgi:archaellum component FlaC
LLFKALKEAAGSPHYASPVTFEEFAQGIMDFPFLLQQFKEEFENMCSNGQTPRSSVEELSQPSPTRPGYYADETASVVEPRLLKEIFEVLRIAQMIGIEDQPSAPEPSLTPRSHTADVQLEGAEIYLTLIGQALSGISHKLNSGLDRDTDIKELHLMTKCLTDALSKLLTSYKTATGEYETRLDLVNDELEGTRQALELAKHQTEVLEENCCQAVGALNQLEWEFQRHKQEAEAAKVERNRLETRLEAISQAEEKTLTEMQSIQEGISTKEMEIERLRREVRRLNSLRMIHEMKKDTFTLERLDQFKHDLKVRNSMPSKAFTAISPKSLTPKIPQRFLFTELRSDNLNDRRIRLAEQGLRRRNEELNVAWKLKTDEVERRYRGLVRELETKNYELLLRVKSLEASKKDMETKLAEQDTPRSSFQIDSLQTEMGGQRPSEALATTTFTAPAEKAEEVPLLPQVKEEKSRYGCCWFWS